MGELARKNGSRPVVEKKNDSDDRQDKAQDPAAHLPDQARNDEAEHHVVPLEDTGPCPPLIVEIDEFAKDDKGEDAHGDVHPRGAILGRAIARGVEHIGQNGGEVYKL